MKEYDMQNNEIYTFIKYYEYIWSTKNPSTPLTRLTLYSRSGQIIHELYLFYIYLRYIHPSTAGYGDIVLFVSI